jgi:hypothetical protein
MQLLVEYHRGESAEQVQAGFKRSGADSCRGIDEIAAQVLAPEFLWAI